MIARTHGHRKQLSLSSEFSVRRVPGLTRDALTRFRCCRRMRLFARHAHHAALARAHGDVFGGTTADADISMTDTAIEIECVAAVQCDAAAIRKIDFHFAAQYVDELFSEMLREIFWPVEFARVNKAAHRTHLFAARLRAEKLIGHRMSLIEHTFATARDDGFGQCRRGCARFREECRQVEVERPGQGREFFVAQR